MSPLLLRLLPIALYALAALTLHRGLRTSPDHSPRIAATLGAGAAITHGILLFGAIHSPNGTVLGITDSASLVGFVIAVTTVLAMALGRLGVLPAVLFLLAGILATGTGLVSGFAETPYPQWEVTAHIILAALAAGWLSMAAVIVLLLAWQQRRLRARVPLGVLSLLPPIESMETALFQAIAGGFAVLTLALLTGFFFVHDLAAQHLVHKMVLAVIAWTIFGTLLWGRFRYGWRGRKALQFTLVGFVTLILAYFGSKFVLETLLGRHWG